MAAIEFVGTSGISVASLLPMEMGLAVSLLIGTLVAGAIGIGLATMPPSALMRWTTHGA